MTLQERNRGTGHPGNPLARIVILLSLFFVIVVPDLLTFSRDVGGPPFPRLANYYLATPVTTRDVEYFSGWDLHVLNWYLDRDPATRRNLRDIKQLNNDAVLLMYHISTAVNVTVSPPDPLETMAEQHDWWLRDYQGNRLVEPYPWKFNHLINFTDDAAASGTHPQGLKPNEYLPKTLIRDHYGIHDYWNGIFYDVYSDNMQFYYLNIKDATVNGIPEFDSEYNGDEPMFDSLWRSGMRTLAENTLALAPNVYIVGNGLHRSAMHCLNGRMQENFSRSSEDLSDLASVVKYIADTERKRPIDIVDGVMEDESFTDFSSMRFSFICAMLIDSYYSTRGAYGGRNRTMWFDEYSVNPNGKVSAITTVLSQPAGEFDETIYVVSTDRFPPKGVITIGGEQIFYASKSSDSFNGCVRGYPQCRDAQAPHQAGATAIGYGNGQTGYLGHPVTPTFDYSDPSVRLFDLFKQAGWYATGDIANEINSRIWIRIFQNGVVILNPGPNSANVTGLGDFGLQKIDGIQDPYHNDGQLVGGSLQIASKDGYVLLR